MARETINRAQSNGHDSQRGMAGSLRELLHDSLSLGELQSQLFLLDVKEGSNRMVTPLITLVAAVCLALGSFPILLAALGLGLNVLGMPVWAAFITAFAVGIGGSGVLALAGWKRLKKEMLILKRSQRELQKNIAWLKSALRGEGSQQAQPRVYS